MDKLMPGKLSTADGNVQPWRESARRLRPSDQTVFFQQDSPRKSTLTVKLTPAKRAGADSSTRSSAAVKCRPSGGSLEKLAQHGVRFILRAADKGAG
jgi:hypothetical protein